MNEPTIQIVGRVGADPELKFTPAGKPVLNVSVAQTARVKKNDEWTDGDTLWFRVSVWGAPAEAVMETVSKGTLVAILGRLGQRTYETKTGEKRTDLTVEAETFAVVPLVKESAARKPIESSAEVAPW